MNGSCILTPLGVRRTEVLTGSPNSCGRPYLVLYLGWFLLIFPYKKRTNYYFIKIRNNIARGKTGCVQVFCDPGEI